jgi:hypothetical protein
MRTLIFSLATLAAALSTVSPSTAETGCTCYGVRGCFPSAQYCVRDASRCQSSCQLETKQAAKITKKQRQ